MKQRLLLFSFILVQFNCILSGQIVFPEAKLFSVNEGLSQSHINEVIQDSRGYIWIATEDGLNRYDGYDFVNYSHQPYDANSLSSNYINAICEDQNGVLWVATNKGLNSFDVVKGAFSNYQHDPKNPGTVSDNIILNVFVDSKKSIWVKTLKSLDLFNQKTKTFQHFPHYYDLFRFVSGNIKFPLFEDKHNRLWVGTKDGLNFFDRDLQLYNRYVSLDFNPQSLSHDEIRSICEDKDGTLWVGTANGLNSYNPLRKEFRRYYPEPNSSVIVSSNRINALYRDKSDRLWVGTTGGLFILNRNEGRFYRVASRNNVSFNAAVYSITQDKSGVFWIGTQKGLIKINSKKPKFNLYRSGETPAYSFTSNDIGSIYLPDKDNLWIGTLGEGLNILNRRTNKVVSYDFSKNSTDEDNYVHYIFELNHGTYWLGTNNGVIVFYPESGKYSKLCENLGIAGCESFLQNCVNSIVRDSKGRIWLGTFHGLYQINSDMTRVKTYLNNPDNTKSLCNNTINSLAADKYGRLWIGTENGLDCLDIEKESFIHYSDSPSSPSLLSSSTIYGLQFDPQGILWIGTASGLNRFNTKDKSVKFVTEKDGLSDNLIKSIVVDNRRNIWVSTNHGINEVNPRDLHVRSFDVYDGLQDYEFNHNAAFKDRNGEMFFGGVAGVNSFYPDSLNVNNYIAPVDITSVELITSKGKIETLNPAYDKLYVPYQTHIFTINFASLDYTLPEKNNFAYKFYPSGKDGDWIKIGNRHSATFSNLKPGEYTFKVKGSNNDLVWNEQGILLTINVDSPFWLKPDAYYVYALIIALSILIFYRYRTYHLRKTNRVLKDREITAKEIERQKELLTVKNKNITDSINYAKRIQEALMPSEKMFRKILPESFVFHQPKDIVSGDFFWISERGNKIFVAAVDCTGHGVPGAFMSIIGFELFRKITHNQGIDDPSQVLNILNQEFEEIFKDVDNVTLKDGMDIALCVIDKTTNILEFSGAVNPVYLIRDNKITEIRGSRFSVGLEDTHDEEQVFENKQIMLFEGDVVYLFSDGYADQFGGPEGKKFKYRRFRHLLLTIHEYPIEEQQRLLDERINRWKGSLEQVDDILVIGFRPVFANQGLKII